jgi:hypothetical protein
MDFMVLPRAVPRHEERGPCRPDPDQTPAQSLRTERAPPAQNDITPFASAHPTASKLASPPPLPPGAPSAPPATPPLRCVHGVFAQAAAANAVNTAEGHKRTDGWTGPLSERCCVQHWGKRASSPRVNGMGSEGLSHNCSIYGTGARPPYIRAISSCRCSRHDPRYNMMSMYGSTVIRM